MDIKVSYTEVMWRVRGADVSENMRVERVRELQNFFFAKNETFSYNKMQQVTHIDNILERLQVMQARAGS